jgi:hypothetical protein
LVQLLLQHNCLWKLTVARYGVLVSEPAVRWARPTAAVIMRAMDGKGSRIVFVACAHTLSGEGGVFVDRAVKRICSRLSVRTSVLSVLQ